MLLRQQVLLAFAFLLFTLPAYAEEKGVALTGTGSHWSWETATIQERSGG